MNKFESEIFGEERSSVSVRERLSQYLSYWPLFLACTALCVGAGIVYTRYAIPKYVATTSFVIKGAEGGKPANEDLIETALNGKREVNLNNEILLIHSTGLIERTVAKNGFNVSYFKKGNILDIEIYKDAPFSLLARQLNDSNGTYRFYIKDINTAGGRFLHGPGEEETSYAFRWNEPFTVSGQSFVLTPKANLPTNGGEYVVQWAPVSATAADLAKNLTAKPFDTKTSVIQLSLKTKNLQKGKDVLNALFAEFNLSDVEDRNRLSETTMQFIDDRLTKISGELKNVEGSLESYQDKNRLVDVKGQSIQSLELSGEASKTMKDLVIQQRVVDMTLEYFLDPANKDKLVPSSLGPGDAALTTLITQYNDLQLKKEKEAPSLAPNSTVLQDLNSQISTLKGSILVSLNGINKSLRLQENNFRQQNFLSQSFLAALPHNERVLQEIKRKQSITEGLYLYLLQKREEAAISRTSANIASYRQIDLASGYGPVEPNSTNILLYSALLGFVLAFGGVYFRNLLNDKITSREDVMKQTSVPLLGQITQIPRRKQIILPVVYQNTTGEQFRAIRINMSFQLKEKRGKVIMITSSTTGDGKSFVSLNLAAVCAMPGKKVALLEFDMRRPIIASQMGIEGKGLTEYLTGDVTDLAKIRYVVGEVPTLHLYPCGLLPANAADLLLKENTARLFEALRAEYDYILIDSPPAGLVSDPFILGSYSDLVIYVIRQQKTTRKQMNFFNELARDKTLPNLTVVLNDARKGTGYGYDEVYGYTSEGNVKAKKTG